MKPKSKKNNIGQFKTLTMTMSPQQNYFDDPSFLSSVFPLHSSSSALLVMMVMSEQLNNAYLQHLPLFGKQTLIFEASAT